MPKKNQSYKLDIATRARARTVSNLVRTEFNKLRDTLRVDVDQRFELYEQFLAEHPLMKEHPKALRAALKEMRSLKTYLRAEIKIAGPEARDAAAERALGAEFKLMAIAGRVSV